MSVTAKRDDMRLIAIIIGEEVSKVRNAETTALLDYGFNLYKLQVIKKQDTVIQKLKFNMGTKDSIDVKLEKDITILSKKSEPNKTYTEKVIVNDTKLPLTKNQKIGVLELYDGSNKIGDYNLIISDNVKKKNLFRVFIDNLKNMITGDLNF